MSPRDDVLATADAAWDTAPSSLKDARDRARHRFEALGFPTTSDEEWRFTSVAPIAGTKFAPAVDRRSALRRADVAPFSLVDASAIELVFVNGLFSSELSSIPTVSRGLRVESLAAELAAGHSEILEKCLTRVAPFEQRAFTALNTGLFVDGAFIHVPAGDTVDAPIHLLFIATTDGRPAMVHPRVLVVVDQSAHASIVESYVSLNGDRYLTNAVTEVVVGENGRARGFGVSAGGGRATGAAAAAAALAALAAAASAARAACATCFSIWPLGWMTIVFSNSSSGCCCA